MLRKKNIKIIVLTLFALLQFIAVFAQTTVKGVVTDGKTGETLPYVSIVIPELQWVLQRMWTESIR